MGFLDKLLGRGKDIAGDVGEKVEGMMDRDKSEAPPPLSPGDTASGEAGAGEAEQERGGGGGGTS